MEEKRKYPRYQAELKVFCESWEPFNSEEKPPDPIPFYPTTQNLSQGGICILTDQLLPVGLKIVMVLSVSSSSDYIKLIGEIAWSKAEGSHSLNGISFCETSPEDEQALEKLRKYLNHELE